MAPQSQCGEGARPHLCMNEWNRLTPVRRRLSLTKAVWGKFIQMNVQRFNQKQKSVYQGYKNIKLKRVFD